MMWTAPSMWEGGTCVIIGGGPSIIEQFNIPSELVQAVYTGKALPEVYTPYLEPLHDMHVIAVNMAYKLGKWVEMMFFGDTGFWYAHSRELIEKEILCVTCAPDMEKEACVKYLQREPQKFGITTDKTKLRWNMNSGSAAINLAVHLGAKRIILLGFDMQVNETKDQHWHKYYKTSKDKVDAVMRNHLHSFPAIARDLKTLGVECINASPKSKIEVFPKMNFKDIPL